MQIDADPDPVPDPAYHFDVDPDEDPDFLCRSGSRLPILYVTLDANLFR